MEELKETLGNLVNLDTKDQEIRDELLEATKIYPEGDIDLLANVIGDDIHDDPIEYSFSIEELESFVYRFINN